MAGMLHDAAYHGQVDVIRRLLASDPSLATAVDETGSPPLHWAIGDRHGAADATQLLLRAAPAAARVVDSFGRTAVHRAVQLAHHYDSYFSSSCSDQWCSIIRQLVAAAPAATCSKDMSCTSYGQTAMHLAAAHRGYRSLDVLRALMAAAPPEAYMVADSHGRCAFAVAVHAENVVVARWLLPATRRASGLGAEDALRAVVAAVRSRTPRLTRLALWLARRPDGLWLYHEGDLLVEIMAAGQLSAAAWRQVPGFVLPRVLPAVLARPHGEMCQLVRRWPPRNLARLRSLVLTLGLLQRRAGVQLPGDIARRILCSVFTPVDERHHAAAAPRAPAEPVDRADAWYDVVVMTPVCLALCGMVLLELDDLARFPTSSTVYLFSTVYLKFLVCLAALFAAAVVKSLYDLCFS